MTYGTFRPSADGRTISRRRPSRPTSRIAAAGLNSIRTYTPPPHRPLDCAADDDLLVMAGLPWEEPSSFLIDRWRDRIG